jgi:hypothetical protein
MKVIITYPPEYRTPMRIENIKDEEDAIDKAAEVRQGFGQALVLTEKEYQELLKLVKDA